ncbi:MAG TPA: GtrA family protein [Polyangiaceae bacterium]|jgi:putative flippase GtrA|nr:GtrA family protein [Polyangiaceae bacterium]
MLSQRAHEAPGVHELSALAKAAFSSGAATVADGVVYQLLLFAFPEHYGFVAAAGAVAGAAVNFLINRHYTFARADERALPQALRYAVVSLATFLALRLCLAITVEGLGWSARVAWLPAKLAAFAVVSYPAQRLWVFSKRSAS